METENRPNAALINKEWFDSASGVLSQEDLAMVVLNACRYVFGMPAVSMRNQSQQVVFAMIRPALDSDITKYRERCVRNAENAKRGRERVVASGTQSQQVGAIPTTTTTTTTTPTTTTTISLSDEEQRKRDRFKVFGYFWSIGSSAPMDELQAFWDYYEALGWKNNKGAVIVSKIAAARMWRRQYETKEPCTGAQAWFKAVCECPVADPNAFKCFRGAEISADKVVCHLGCSAQFLAQLEQAVPNLKGTLQAFWRGLEVILEPAG